MLYKYLIELFTLILASSVSIKEKIKELFP